MTEIVVKIGTWFLDAYFFLIFQTFSILISLAILATSTSVRACIKLSLVKRINNVLAMIYGVALQK